MVDSKILGNDAMVYGVYDTKDGTWLGNERGPKGYPTQVLAQIAAQIVEYQVLGTDLACRFVVKPLPSNREWTFRDCIPTLCGAEEALTRLENYGETEPREDIVIDAIELLGDIVPHRRQSDGHWGRGLK